MKYCFFLSSIWIPSIWSNLVTNDLATYNGNRTYNPINTNVVCYITSFLRWRFIDWRWFSINTWLIRTIFVIGIEMTFDLYYGKSYNTLIVILFFICLWFDRFCRLGVKFLSYCIENRNLTIHLDSLTYIPILVANNFASLVRRIHCVAISLGSVCALLIFLIQTMSYGVIWTQFACNNRIAWNPFPYVSLF